MNNCKFANVNSITQKIVIASPNFLLAEGIRNFFNSNGFESVSVIENQDLLERTLIKEIPEYVLIDDSSKHFKVEKTIAFLSFTKPAQMILLSNLINQERFDLLKKVGVRFFISSEISREELFTLLQFMELEKDFSDEKIKRRLTFDAEEAFRNTCAELNISEREVEIIKLIAEGYINKEIADMLFLSTHTVNTHRKNIMSKLGVNNATGIVIFAVKEKLVSPKDFLFSSKHQ
jgi:DNA-binding NarL/FixJ family response regulator